MKRNTLVALLAAAIEMQVVTGCKAIPEMQRFVLEDGTVIVADTDADGPSKEATEIFKRLYAAVGSDADIDDTQTYQLALAKMLDKVDLDDPAVQEALGDMHYLGCGVKRDVAKAVGWYKRAAENNRPDAQTWIGWAYWYGFHCLPCDQVEAVKWFRKAAENGSADAPRLLGAAYAEGRGGLPVDKKLAFQCFLKSAERGNAQAQFTVGKAYEEGDGVARNAVEAVKWYEKSSRTFVNAAEALARIYEEGRDGVPKDSVKAACWRRNFNERAAR